MDNVPYDEWCAYICETLKKHGIADGPVLDLGCGTGELTRRLAACGYDMTGVDVSVDMLQKAMEKQTDPPILYLLQVEEAALPEARLYLQIVSLGLVGSIGYNTNAGILQGLGNSKTPLMFLSIAMGINIVLDLLFVAVFRWGVAGVAFATIIAQWFSWIFGIFYINRMYSEFHLHLLMLADVVIVLGLGCLIYKKNNTKFLYYV